jgi:hypothetical protein
MIPFHDEFRPSEKRWKGLEVWSYKHRTLHEVNKTLRSARRLRRLSGLS